MLLWAKGLNYISFRWINIWKNYVWQWHHFISCTLILHVYKIFCLLVILATHNSALCLVSKRIYKDIFVDSVALRVYILNQERMYCQLSWHAHILILFIKHFQQWLGIVQENAFLKKKMPGHLVYFSCYEFNEFMKYVWNVCKRYQQMFCALQRHSKTFQKDSFVLHLI